jgi:hypothetical protein
LAPPSGSIKKALGDVNARLVSRREKGGFLSEEDAVGLIPDLKSGKTIGSLPEMLSIWAAIRISG